MLASTYISCIYSIHKKTFDKVPLLNTRLSVPFSDILVVLIREAVQICFGSLSLSFITF